MQIHNVQQGSEEWKKLRLSHFCASDAAAMLGLSSFKTRNEYLKEKALGIEIEHDERTKKRFQDGHDAEANARNNWILENCEALTPSVITDEIDGLPLLASLDGITSDRRLIWENKLWNANLAGSVFDGNVPDAYWPQLEQGLLLSGATSAILSVSDGTDENTIECDYESVPERRAHLIAGWKQFAEDLKNYKPSADDVAKPAQTIENLPVLRVEIIGSVTSSNLIAFESAAMKRIGQIKTDLQTDQDFVDADATVKFLGEGEKKLDLVKEQALSQTASIEDLFKSIDRIKNEMKQKRLYLEKLVKTRKENIRFELIDEAKKAFDIYTKPLSDSVADRFQLLFDVPDFAGAIKGLKSIESMRNKLDTALANGKIEASTLHIDIQNKIKLFDENVGDYSNLFHDLSAIIYKPFDDFTAVVKLRISEHKAAEEKRIEEAVAKAQEKAQEEAQSKAEANQSAQQAQSPVEAPQRKAAPVQQPVTAPDKDNDIIRAFLQERDFGKREQEIRAILVEFVKFQEGK